jgi:hypothetical protein
MSARGAMPPARSVSSKNASQAVVESVISPGFHTAMGTRLVAGRDFDQRDTSTSPKGRFRPDWQSTGEAGSGNLGTRLEPLKQSSIEAARAVRVFLSSLAPIHAGIGAG